MSAFNEDEPTTIREILEDGESWVEIRAPIAWEDVLSRFAEGSDGTQSERRKHAMRMTLVLGIAAWGGPAFTNDAGEAYPVTEERMRKLRATFALDLINLVDKHNPNFNPSGKAKASDGPASSSAAADA